MSTVLLLGGTGAMGVYLREILAKMRNKVIVTSRLPHPDTDNIHFCCGNAQDDDFLRSTIAQVHPDAIVDFMIYSTEQFRKRAMWLPNLVEHYLFLSSYRVFADSKILTEESPRLLDVCADAEYLKTDEYALTKARQEDILFSLPKRNWTIIRPSITYSKSRFQFGCLEANFVCYRALQGLPVIIPAEVLDKQTSLTWGGDVARMIAGLVLNPKALNEVFICATSEHHSWREVAEVYHKHIGLEYKICTLEDYVHLLRSPYQTKYDRMFNRIIDNTKILKVTGIEADSLLTLEEGLGRELDNFLLSPQFQWIDAAKNAQMDRLTHSWPSFREKSVRQIKNYLFLRYPTLVNSFPIRVYRKIKKYVI